MTILMNVKDLIDGCILHHKNAQNLLYDNYSSRLYGVCLRYACDRDDAQDILQESFIKIFKNIHNLKYQDENAFYGWMHKITVNTALNHYRDSIKKNLQQEITENETYSSEFDESTIYDHILDHVSHTTLLKLIQELPNGYRTIFNLYAFENQTHKEISTELNISVNTSKTQLFKARKMLSSQINCILATNQVKKVI